MGDMPDYHQYVVPVTVAIPTGESPIVDVAKYQATAVALADGSRGPLLIDEYGRLFVIVYGAVEVDHTKIKGVALKDPTTAESVPVSIESPAIAYDAANDVFKIRIIQPSTVLAGEKDVAEAGTAEALGSGAIVAGIVIQAKPANTGTIKVGNSSDQFVELEAGENVPWVADNLSKIYIDSTEDGEGVNYGGG